MKREATVVPDDLVDRIYEAAVVPELWHSVLASLTRAADARDALLGLIQGEHVRIVSTSPGFVEIWREVLKVFPGASNERTRRLLAAQHAGFLVDADVFDPEEMARLPVYCDHLVPAGYGLACATSIPTPSGDVIIVHVEAAFANGPIRRQVVSAFDGLRPHLARAGLLASRLGLERVQTAVATLEAIGLPAAVLGPGGRTLAVNELLGALVPDVAQDRPSRIALADASADRLLAAAIERFGVAGASGEVASIPIRARRERPPIVVHLVPVRGAAHDIFVQAAAILVATPVTPRPPLAPGVVQGLFDLTPGEAKLASLVAAGHDPRSAAGRLGVTEETARTVLKRVFAKTGTHRQAELVGLLQGTPVASPPGGGGHDP